MTMFRTFNARWRAGLGLFLLLVFAHAPSIFAQVQQRAQSMLETDKMGAAEVTAEALPNDDEPVQGDTIEVTVTIDTRNLQGADNRLAAYQARFLWTASVLQFVDFMPGLPPWDKPNVNTSSAPNGRIDWNAFIAGGVVPGTYTLLRMRFKAIGAENASTQLDLSFSELTTAFARDLRPLLQIIPHTITIRKRNQPPQIQPIADQTVEEGKTRTVAVQASDPDGNSIKLIKLNFPSFAQLLDNGNGTGQITIMPALGNAGSYPKLGVIATDNGAPALSDTALFDLVVNPAENPPALDSIPDQSMNENDTLNVKITAKDPDGDDIILNVANLPRFGSFTDNHNGTGVIHFAPGFEDAGEYANIEVGATDSSTPPLTTKRTFRLTVHNVNRPPLLQKFTFDTLGLNEGSVTVLVIPASDPDGDSLRFSARNLPAFCQLTDAHNGTATLRIAPGFNDAGTYPQITITVTDNGIPSLSDSDAFDLTVVDNTPILVCSVGITSPLDSASICGDSVQVCLSTTITGGQMPYTVVRTVNGVVVKDSCNKVPVVNGANMLVAKLTVTDAQGTTSTDFDTVTVLASVIKNQVTITAPGDSTYICGNSVTLTGVIASTGGVPPLTSTCTVNGNAASVSGNTFSSVLSLAPGSNRAIVVCTTTDATGCAATTRDTVMVFSDPTPPTVNLNFDNLPVISGEILDPESGIATVEIIEATNRVVTIDSFIVGDKRVTFSSDKLDPNKRSSFTLRVTNVAGCESIVDPVYVKITAARGVYDLSFNLLQTDRYLFVKNDGLQKIRFLINGQGVTLEASPNGRGSEGNLHFMPAFGLRSIDLTPFMRQGENFVDIVCTGAAEAAAELLFSDIQVADGVATGIADGNTAESLLPATFALGANFPNPFNPETAISFEVPAGWTAPVTLRIFNVQGQLIQTLVEGAMPPGKHNVRWNGKDSHGEQVATGMYLYQIVSGNYHAVRKMLMAK